MSNEQNDAIQNSELKHTQLSDRYAPKEVEVKLYKWWADQNYFSADDKSKKPPYTIILPPPNVTGQLHIGHALNHSIQDVLIRWKRMSGFNTLWLPGTDHAGIATQGVVEKELAKENTSRHELGRDKFVERVWAWKKKYGDRIAEQMKSLGDSCDWNRFTFTLDEGVSKAVRKVFFDLYKKGYLYKGTRLIHWSPKLESALSDLEVEYKEIKGHIYHIRYALEKKVAGDSSNQSAFSDGVVVATTRPETLLGDVAVAVHPDDERYSHLVGKNVLLPLTKKAIPVIADTMVDMTFGSGVVKITPAHDFNDYETALRHKLPMINILNRDGTLNDNGLNYKGLKVQEARKRVLEDLEKLELLVKTESHVHSVGHCSRSGAVAEPILSEQWFVKMEKLAAPAKAVVENGTIVFEPETWTKTYLHWMNNIKDWCVSRQLWWGHRIPAWYCLDCKHINVAETDPSKCEACGKKNLKQDEDVLDTWFSSALWPFSTLGWPQDTLAQKTFYPTDVLVTGHDIIFFWVARMVMMGLEVKGDVPFRKVIITGLIRDAEGNKMSKSLGNALDPLELIEEYGADSVRFTLMSQFMPGKDMKFSVPRLEGYRNFMNKIWNAARFSLSVLNDFTPPPEGDRAVPSTKFLSDADVWITYKLEVCETKMDEHLKNLRLADAAATLYDFVWHQFCDWYLELIKPVVYGTEENNLEYKKATQLVLAQTLNRIVRLLHPFVPFISEEIYQKLPIKNAACILESYPNIRSDKEWLKMGDRKRAEELDLVLEVISAIRNIRGENRIKPGEEVRVRISPKDTNSKNILLTNKSYISKLSKLSACEISSEGSTNKCALTPIHIYDFNVDVIVYLEGVVDLSEECKRISKAIEKFQKEMSGLSSRLKNDNFTKNAPAEVVEQGRAQLIEIDSKIKALQENLERLN